MRWHLTAALRNSMDVPDHVQNALPRCQLITWSSLQLPQVCSDGEHVQERHLGVCQERRELHNQLTDMKGAIRVVARARPMSAVLDAQAAAAPAAVQCNPLTSSMDVLQNRCAWLPLLVIKGLSNCHGADTEVLFLDQRCCWNLMNGGISVYQRCLIHASECLCRSRSRLVTVSEAAAAHA